MRKAIIGLMGLLLAATSCTIETSDNGSLDGLWQLTAVDSLTGGRQQDMRYTGFFWAVQHHLLEVRNLQQGLPSIFFRFQHQDNRLILSEPVVNDRMVGDSMLTDVQLLQPYGLTRLTDTLRILQLNDENMTLESSLVRLHFRKY